jgi:hypothetical protein
MISEISEFVPTFADGRKKIQELFHSFASLEKHGWKFDDVGFMDFQIEQGEIVKLPIISLSSKPRLGRYSTWLLSGIHGEEPAGPNALAESVDLIRQFGEKHSVVLYPLCNPVGYALNRRYFNKKNSSGTFPGLSVGDSEHLLLTQDMKPRMAFASSKPAEDLTMHMLRTAGTHPPVRVYDLHEDSLLREGYVYSQGIHGIADQAAKEMLDALAICGIPIKMKGKTRFGESIVNGMVDGIANPVNDGSIDELLASDNIIIKGRISQGPNAETVIVVEMPAKNMSIKDRIAAYCKVIEHTLSFYI